MSILIITYAEKVYYLCGKSLLPMRKKSITYVEKVYYLCGKSLLPMTPKSLDISRLFGVL